MGAHWSKNRGREWSSSWSAPLELIDRSSINDSDLISNLRWSLTEAMRWNERALSVKDIICVEGSDQTKNLSKSQQEERYLATLELLDNVLHDGSQPTSTTTSSASSTATKAKESVKSLFTSKSSDPEKAASAASKEASKSPPSSTVGAVTLLPPSSSKLFGAAACKFVIASINAASLTGARSTIAGETRSKISQAMSAIQKTIASAASQAQSGGIGTQQPTISGESGGESNILPQQTIQEGAKGQLAFCHDDNVEQFHGESMNERVEIACKYIYLSSLMKSLSHSTAWCYQLHEKMKWFTTCINDLNVSIAKGNHQQNELHKKQMELAKDRVYLLLQDGLKSHDRWRCVLRLLYRDFELCIARHKLMVECARFSYYRENPRAAGVWSMNEIEEKLNTLNAQKQPLDLEIEKNERDALSCGLAFLDKNLSGSLEAEESPELNAKLFRMLDLQNRAAISYTDLHGGVLSIQSKLENITARIQVLQQQNEQLKQRSMYASYQSTATAGIASAGGADEAVIMQNDAEIEQLKRASVDQWNNLQQIYSAFFNAFAQSVFPSVQLNEIDQLQSQSLANGDGIVQIIDQIAKNALTDPLITMQTKLQRGDESLISQASLDAAIIAQSQQTPLTAALGGETAPLTIPMVLATTPATEHRPPAAFEQTTKPKSAMEVKAAEKAVEASKRELGREKQFAEHPSETGSMEQQLGVKDVQSNVQAAREAARGRAAEMRTSEMENVSPRWPKQESQTTDRPSYQPSFAEKEERTVPQKEIESYSPTITRQTPLAQTRAAEPPTDKEPPSATEYQEKGLRADDQQMKFEGRHVHQRVAMPAAHYEQQPIEKGPSQQPAIGEENISRGEYVEKPASLEQRTPPSDYDQSQQQRFLSEGGRPSEYQQQPIKGGYEEEQQRLGYGGTGEQYWTPAPTEKGTGASQQKETQFSAEPSMMTERPESIPQSPERQSKSWTESIKETVRGVTGGSQTGTH